MRRNRMILAAGVLVCAAAVFVVFALASRGANAGFYDDGDVLVIEIDECIGGGACEGIADCIAVEDHAYFVEGADGEPCPDSDHCGIVYNSAIRRELVATCPFCFIREKESTDDCCN